MLVQDPLSGYLHEVPDAQSHYAGYGGGYYGGYDEYVDPSMAEYPGELGHLGLFPFFLPKIISAITGGGGAPRPPQPVMATPVRASFAPSPGLRAYITAVVNEVLAQRQAGAGQMFAPGGMRYRRRRRR
jgi:hypothetical protein